jgi:hypothetical protein
MSDNLNRLVGETDATMWGKAFMQMLAEQEGEGAQLPVGEGQMITWFAGAIMSGYDLGLAHERRRDIVEKLREVVFQAAGAATVPFMQDHPDYVFPDQRVIEGIEAVLRDFGIPASRPEPDEEVRKDVAYHEAEERKEQDEGASEIPRAVYDEMAPPAPKRSAYHHVPYGRDV